MSITAEIKAQIKRGNKVVLLIAINTAVFLLAAAYKVFLFIAGNNVNEIEYAFDQLVLQVAMPLDVTRLIHKPWTVISHFYFHAGFFHLFFNMYMLWFFGKLLADYCGNSKINAVYVLGAISGAFFSFLCYQLIPSLHIMSVNSIMYGASAGVLAIVIAVATLLPNFSILVFFVGEIKLKWIAVFVVVIDIISLPGFENVGGHLAHLGGALFGYLFMLSYKKGNDWSKGYNAALAIVSLKKKPKLKVVHYKKTTDEEYNYNKNLLQQKVDAILDKISKSGYDSLSKEEKDILFKASNK